jgi:hypothetical protein
MRGMFKDAANAAATVSGSVEPWVNWFFNNKTVQQAGSQARRLGPADGKGVEGASPVAIAAIFGGTIALALLGCAAYKCWTRITVPAQDFTHGTGGPAGRSQ